MQSCLIHLSDQIPPLRVFCSRAPAEKRSGSKLIDLKLFLILERFNLIPKSLRKSCKKPFKKCKDGKVQDVWHFFTFITEHQVFWHLAFLSTFQRFRSLKFSGFFTQA
jgi:hypothetical protein